MHFTKSVFYTEKVAKCHRSQASLSLICIHIPKSNLDSLMSMPMIRFAPACLQPMSTAKPMHPRPQTPHTASFSTWWQEIRQDNTNLRWFSLPANILVNIIVIVTSKWCFDAINTFILRSFFIWVIMPKRCHNSDVIMTSLPLYMISEGHWYTDAAGFAYTGKIGFLLILWFVVCAQQAPHVYRDYQYSLVLKCMNIQIKMPVLIIFYSDCSIMLQACLQQLVTVHSAIFTDHPSR